MAMSFDAEDPIWDMASTILNESRTTPPRDHDAYITAAAKEAEDPSSKSTKCTCNYCNMTVYGVLCDGNIVCTYCNSVLMRQMDYGAEWRLHGADGSGSVSQQTDNVRCCPPTSTLGSIIGGGGNRRHSSTWKRVEVAHGGESKRAGTDIQRFQAWNSLTYRQRVLNNVFDVLVANAAQNGLPTCILEDAKVLYKRISEVRITRGENRSSVIAVSIYIACMQNKVPRSLQEVATMFDLKPSSLTHALHIYKESIPEVAAMKQTCSATDFIYRFCSSLHLDSRITDVVRRVVEKADEMAIICDAMPISIVGGAIAFVCDHYKVHLNKKDIATTCKIAAVTVTKMMKRFIEHREVLLPIDNNNNHETTTIQDRGIRPGRDLDR